MKSIDMKITEEIAILSVSGSGYTKEINLVSWNGAEPKYDIRSWSPGREKCGKGLALTQTEAKNLFLALQKVFHALQPPVYTSRLTARPNFAFSISCRSEVPIPLRDSRSVPHM